MENKFDKEKYNPPNFPAFPKCSEFFWHKSNKPPTIAQCKAALELVGDFCGIDEIPDDTLNEMVKDWKEEEIQFLIDKLLQCNEPTKLNTLFCILIKTQTQQEIIAIANVAGIVLPLSFFHY